MLGLKLKAGGAGNWGIGNRGREGGVNGTVSRQVGIFFLRTYCKKKRDKRKNEFPLPPPPAGGGGSSPTFELY